MLQGTRSPLSPTTLQCASPSAIVCLLPHACELWSVRGECGLLFFSNCAEMRCFLGGGLGGFLVSLALPHFEHIFNSFPLDPLPTPLCECPQIVFGEDREGLAIYLFLRASLSRAQGQLCKISS